METKASLMRIIQNDFLSFLGAIAPPITWAMFIMLPWLQGGEIGSLVYVGIAVTVVGAAVLIWRVRLISSTFESERAIPATISNLSFFRDRGRVEYIYMHQGQKYATSNAILKNRRTQSLAIGQEVVVMVNPNNPKQAFIRDLYR